MIRITTLTDHRRQWLALALIPLALGACSGKGSKPAGSTDTVQSTAAATRVAPAAGPNVAVSAPPAPRVVTFEAADSLFKERKFGEARARFEEFVESYPESAQGYYMLGLSAWKSGDLPRAEHALETAIEKDPKSVKSLLNSARVLLELGRGHEALDRVNVARSLDSTSSEAIRLLARVHDELGDAAAAIKTYREALVQDERDVWAMNNLGMLYIRQRDFQSALAPLARAVELRPSAPVFQNNLGIALELTGHPVEAKSAYDAALKADSTYAKAIANAKRLGAVAVDSTKSTGVDLKELAELFRQYVRMWKDSIPH